MTLLYNLNRSEIRKAVLDRHRIGEHCIFWLAGVEKQYIVNRWYDGNDRRSGDYPDCVE